MRVGRWFVQKITHFCLLVLGFTFIFIFFVCGHGIIMLSLFIVFIIHLHQTGKLCLNIHELLFNVELHSVLGFIFKPPIQCKEIHSTP